MKNPLLRIAVAALIVLTTASSFAQQKGKTRFTRQDYIDMYAGFAVQEMLLSGVPASITLAQGILESGDGNSGLAKNARNHFGIKCHGMWEGEKYYMDDDAKGECFRVYESVFDSYKDHSAFLSGRQRYADLFKLKLTDYKGWARGLKKAGYATNPKYPALLIKIIEENNLSKYDRMKKPPKGGLKVPKDPKESPEKPVVSESPSNVEHKDKAVVTAYSRQVYLRNGIKYIRIKEGDSFQSLERMLGMRTWQFVKYNDLNEKHELVPGSILYLQPKKNKTRKADYHIVSRGQTLKWISQEYGVKLKKLIKYNALADPSSIDVGQKIWLRKPRR